MIPLEIIQELIQQKLGFNYHVFIDNACDVEDDRTPVILYATRVPFATDPKTEALQLRLQMYAKGTVTQEIKDTNNDIKALFDAVNGVKFSITDNGTTYKLSLYLDSVSPEFVDNDSGEVLILYQINGTGLTTSSDIVFAQDIEISIDSHQLKVVGYSINKTEEHRITSTKDNPIERKAQPLNRVRSYTIEFLLDSSSEVRAIENEITDGNDSSYSTYSLSVKKSDGTTTTRTVRLASGVHSGQVGGFAVISATFEVA